MLEIIAIVSLGKSISKIIREKGRKPLLFVLLMVVMWLSFEVIGAVIGVILLGEGIGAYLFAIFGAALGGFLSYIIAKNASPIETEVEFSET
ncbi:MAG: hypothetical protein R8G66_21605 [Cytophagales bacterium]|nr:hypothetical protein [Cytophagales bacterium]